MGRKKKKAQLRQLWIMRINIMTREFCSLKYSNFISKLRIVNIKLNRKMLAQLSIIDSITFLSLQKQFLK